MPNREHSFSKDETDRNALMITANRRPAPDSLSFLSRLLNASPDMLVLLKCAIEGKLWRRLFIAENEMLRKAARL
ncbi:MAG TPA: hypothetical protein VLH56_10930 [Dissulfurispiraceae bacterium]|nr:hypothetical protein [Dissulfurispiraceae bacterium]